MQPHTVRRMQQQPAKTKNTCRKRRNSYPELLETEISARDVPAAIMDALQNSAYNQYKIEDITAIERPDGLFYDFELKQDNNEIHIILDSEAKIVIKSSTIAPGYDW